MKTMKLKYRYMIAILLMASVTGCEDKLEVFEQPSSVPAPTALGTITSEALPGQIKLQWEVPADSNYSFVQVKYFDPLTKKNACHLVSIYANSLLVDGTRARYGEYEFSFQTFNSKNEGGEIKTIKAVSGKAQAVETITKSKIALTVAQLSSNYPEPTEGPIKNLLDGDANSFFHTRWSNPQHDLPHYIQVNLNESHENFCFYYQNRNGSQVGPEVLEVQISNDGESWETISTITSGLPSASKAEYTSDLFRPGKGFTYFRYNVTKTYGNSKYFNLAEFALYDAEIKIYDPETDEND